MKKLISHSLIALSMSAPSFLCAITDATWTRAGMDTFWNNDANWSYTVGPDAFPNGIDTIARFDGTEPTLINLGQPITVGSIFVTAGGYAIGTNDLTFSVSSGSAICNIQGTSFALSGDTVSLQSPLIYTNEAGPNNAAISAVFVTNGNDLTLAGGPFTYTNLAPIVSTGGLIFNGGSFVNTNALQATFGFISGPSGTLDLSMGQTFTIGSSVNSTFGGVINLGANSTFRKLGSGELTLTGTNTISGFMRLDEGTLSFPSTASFGTPGGFAIGTNGTAILQITGTTSISNNGTCRIRGTSTFDIGTDASLAWTSSVIEDQGVASVVKTGGGNLTFNNASYTGSTTINAGTLNITGSLSSATTVNGATFNVSGTTSGATTVNIGGSFIITGTATAPTTVNVGGMLKGTGTLQNVTLNSGGMIIPGLSIGTLNVSGDLSLNSTSITQIEISPTDSSKILVAGTAALGGFIQVVQDSGTYPDSNSYEILNAAGGLTNSFNPIVFGGSEGFNFSLLQTMNSVFLQYAISTPVFPLIPTSDTTGQATKFAEYLNRNVPGSSVTSDLAALTGNTLLDALLSASPSRNAFAPFAIQNTMVSLSDLVSGHLVDQRFYHTQKKYNPNVAALMDQAASFTADASGRMVLPRNCESQSVWVGVIGEYAHQDSLDQNPAFHFWSGGSMIGWDFYGDQNLFGFGGGAAYTHLIQDENGGNAKINYYFASLYDTVYGPCDFPLYIELALWGVYNQIHNYRNI
jgi:autotransporter-associated beta strand protein